jgi:hypothetical protein
VAEKGIAVLAIDLGGHDELARAALTSGREGINYPPWGISPQEDSMTLPDPYLPAEESAPVAGGRSLRHATLWATVASAVAASVCCIGPLLAALLGATSLGALVAFHRYRPYFTGITLLFLAGAFYTTYRKKPEACQPGSVCATAGPARVERINRVILWGVTVIVLLVLTFPTWSGWIWG